MLAAVKAALYAATTAPTAAGVGAPNDAVDARTDGETSEDVVMVGASRAGNEVTGRAKKACTHTQTQRERRDMGVRWSSTQIHHPRPNRTCVSGLA